MIEILKRVCPHFGGNADYTYVGFGGPFLEDFRLIDYFFPEMKMVSMENDPHTFRRQQFHRFSRRIRLEQTSDIAFLESMDEDSKIALWLDYTTLKPSYFEALNIAFRKAASGSVIRISFGVNIPGHTHREAFVEAYDSLLPVHRENIFDNRTEFVRALLSMTVAAMTPVAGDNFSFVLLNTAFYKDGAPMLTVTGVKSDDEDPFDARRVFRRFDFFNPNEDPINIDVPELSIAERMKLAKLLPMRTSGSSLRRNLGYNVEDDVETTEKMLKNYAAFARYLPHFGRLQI